MTTLAVKTTGIKTASSCHKAAALGPNLVSKKTCNKTISAQCDRTIIVSHCGSLSSPDTRHDNIVCTIKRPCLTFIAARSGAACCR